MANKKKKPESVIEKEEKATAAPVRVKKTVKVDASNTGNDLVVKKPIDRNRLNLNQPINFILQDQRERKGVSLTGLAKLIGVSRNHMYEIEEGKGMPSFEILNKWAHELGMQVTLKAIPYVPMNPRGKNGKKKKDKKKAPLYSKVKIKKLKK